MTPFIQILHRQLGHAADDVEHRADRRGDQADGIVDDEQDTEIDRVDARLLDHRHQNRRHDQDRRGRVHGSADQDDQHHDGNQEQRLVVHQRFEQRNEIAGVHRRR